MEENLLKTAKRMFKELNLDEITLRDGGCEITMKRSPSVNAPVKVAEQSAPSVAPVEKSDVAEQAYSHCKEIKAPLVGVFYAAGSPDSAPFVKLGDKVKKGQVVCIIEAMKMMNEIRADDDGIVLDICAENSNVVEYGQTLFKLG